MRTVGERVLGFAELMLDPSKYSPKMDKKYSIAKVRFLVLSPLFGGIVCLLFLLRTTFLRVD